MELKEAIEMVSEACYHYDGELYENCNYSEAFDTVLEELDKKDKVINLMAEEITYMDYIGKRPSKKHIKEKFYKKVEKENE